jgi:hypothetical protein
MCKTNDDNHGSWKMYWKKSVALMWAREYFHRITHLGIQIQNSIQNSEFVGDL